jgi:hypothetical protein
VAASACQRSCKLSSHSTWLFNEERLQITVPGPEALAEDAETILRFKRFAVDDKTYIKALKRLLDKANVA